jgi:hypothetical protein
MYRRSGGIVRLRRRKSVPRERASFSLCEHRLERGRGCTAWRYMGAYGEPVTSTA